MSQPKLLILTDICSYGGNQKKPLTGYETHQIEEKCKRAGLLPSQYEIASISPEARFPRENDYEASVRRINEINPAVIVTLDEAAMRFVTGKKQLRKWQLSPLDTLGEFQCRKAIPSFHPRQIRKEYYLGFYLELAIRRASKALTPGPWERKEKRFHLNPCFDETISILESIRDTEWLSIDIETGRNQINTVGFAWTPSDGIAIKVLPDEMSDIQHHKLWLLIAELCGNDAKKVMQNGIYERLYFSRYGVHVNNFAHDTMCAMKLLWPEFEKGLGNVGRIHTMEPYWKDIGKVASEEGSQKDWGNIRDWREHLVYNCLDHTGTLEAALSQRQALEERGLLPLYENYIQRLFDLTYEMAARGLPLSPEIRDSLVKEYEERSKELTEGLSLPINPRSTKQKLSLLRSKGIKLPRKRSKSTGQLTESADELSLKKIRLKYPGDEDIRRLLEVAEVEKALSSYLRVRTFSDNRIRFMLDPFSTETGRMACKKDAWDRGFNAQTMGKKIKKMIEWPESANRVFVEIDLRQAESRFVAYDACEETLLGMLERGEDVHRYVAAEIYSKPMPEITHEERQLGKKSGHGANYSMGAATFQDSCLKEMDLVLSKKESEKVLEAYHKLFPKIRQWHHTIKRTLYQKRHLTNPLGLERYFYGRMDDQTFREAYAYRPQSTIPMITNYLMFGLAEERKAGRLSFDLHNQVHDSIVLSCRPDSVGRIADFALNLEKWHPEVILPAGKLWIPTELQCGRNLGELEDYEPNC